MTIFTAPAVAAVITIASDDQLSAEVDIGHFNEIALMMPAAFTGTALTFEASSTSGGTFTAVTDASGSAISFTVAAARVVVLTADQQAALSPLRYVKLKSGSSEAGNRTINIIGSR